MDELSATLTFASTRWLIFIAVRFLDLPLAPLNEFDGRILSHEREKWRLGEVEIRQFVQGRNRFPSLAWMRRRGPRTPFAGFVVSRGRLWLRRVGLEMLSSWPKTILIS